MIVDCPVTVHEFMFNQIMCEEGGWQKQRECLWWRVSFANRGDKFIMIPDAWTYTFISFLTLPKAQEMISYLKKYKMWGKAIVVRNAYNAKDCSGYSGCGFLGAQIIQWPNLRCFDAQTPVSVYVIEIENNWILAESTHSSALVWSLMCLLIGRIYF